MTVFDSHSQATNKCGGVIPGTNDTWGCGTILKSHSGFRAHLNSSPGLACWSTLWNAEAVVITRATEYMKRIGSRPMLVRSAPHGGAVETATNVVSCVPEITATAAPEKKKIYLAPRIWGSKALRIAAASKQLQVLDCPHCDGKFSLLLLESYNRNSGRNEHDGLIFHSMTRQTYTRGVLKRCDRSRGVGLRHIALVYFRT